MGSLSSSPCAYLSLHSTTTTSTSTTLVHNHHHFLQKNKQQIAPAHFSKVSFHKNKPFLCLSAVATPKDTSTAGKESELLLLESKKHDLLKEIQDTKRGLVTTLDQRSSIEQALVCVEKYDAGTSIDLNKLDGTWRLQYTSAPDVLVLFESAARFPFFQVGQIFQKFECRDQSDGGIVRNVVRWSIPTLLEILQFLQTFKARVPVTSPGRQSAGGLYYLSYLDGNMLLGRAVGGGGVFVFTRAQPLQ
ncbi:hypothetical protein IFM89_037869 [Coptis chinensis]|uniref:Plastid lipid-associated protein/fibrillin conserved domain-containing protein n=1 Tax=Coptis chinensis TaxID=261450 RepID=A0A835HT32_9MAGN|nr:hypothetical protein IFM89_037869 [Coptis chinensis]